MGRFTLCKVGVWKEHCCVGCGSTYRYKFKRKKIGKGRTLDEAQANAQAILDKMLANQSEMQPCPECGRYQPDMIAFWRWRWHGYLMLPAAVALVMLGLLVGGDYLALSWISWLAAASTGLLALPHLFIDFINPNARWKLARRARKERAIRASQPDANGPSENSVGNGITKGHGLSYLLFVASALLFLVPVAVRSAGNLKSNPDWHPEVVGPGEATRIYFPTAIRSLRGLWSGSPSVTLLNSGELGIPGSSSLEATGHSDRWGDEISIDEHEGRVTTYPRVEVRLPNNPDLVGKTLKLRIDMEILYPLEQETNTFHKTFINQREAHTHTTTLVISRAHAGRDYLLAWWISTSAGICLFVLACVLLAYLARRFRHKALPARISSPELLTGDLLNRIGGGRYRR